jgi:hypothetical protein
MPGTLDTLKKGLKALEKQVKERKDQLTSCVASGKPITGEEEEWLDNGGGNLIEEVYAVDTLEKALNYEKAFEKLEDKYKAAVMRLLNLASDGVKVVAGNKRKSLSVIVMLHIIMTADEHKGPEAKPKGHESTKGKKKQTLVKKENMTLEQRIEILKWHKTNKAKQWETAAHFNDIWPNLKLTQPLISDWERNAEKWQKQWEQSNSSGRSAKRVCQTQHPEVTDMMDLWIAKAMADNIILTGEVLCQKWTTFANLAGVPEDEHLSLSEGWLTRFKGRYGLKDLKRYGEAASANPEVIETERSRIRELLKEHGYQLRDIFNMDETGLFYAYAVPFYILYTVIY